MGVLRLRTDKGYRMMLRSLVALTRGAGAFDVCMPMPFGSQAKDCTGIFFNYLRKSHLKSILVLSIRINESMML